MKFGKIWNNLQAIAREGLKREERLKDTNERKEEKDKTTGRLWGSNTLSPDIIVISGNLPRFILKQHAKVLAQRKSGVTANIKSV